jgi:hypothetical protein
MARLLRYLLASYIAIFSQHVSLKLMAEDPRPTSEAARQLASMRRKRTKTCPVCGTVFEAYGKQLYDKDACAKKAWRDKQPKKASQ